MKTNFYDIESLSNVFTLANYRSHDDAIEMYYLVDDDSLVPSDFAQRATDRIHEKNKNFKGTVEFYNLKEESSNVRLAKTFGLSTAYYVNNPKSKSKYPDEYRLVCDTDENYDPDEHPYLLGYNSYNYDTTMLTLYLTDALTMKNNVANNYGISFVCQTAAHMRQYNDELFSAKFKDNMATRLTYQYKNGCKPQLGYDSTSPNYNLPQHTVRKNMLMSGRHLDVARLNEKQSKVALKRILGMLGYQILESNKLRPGQDTIENDDQLIDLMAYNVSDVVNLKKLFHHKTYMSSFTLKSQLLKTYPELVYEEKDNTYKPNISPYSVRKDRLTIDSSSAQFATKALCPYGHLHDYDTVSYMYPSEAKSKELGIPRVNVLEETKKFFYKNFQQPEVREKFDVIYNWYKSIEGKNFNASNNYLIDHDIDPELFNALDLLPPELKVHKLSEIPSPNTCLCYFTKDGEESSCFVNFSTGGVHGAEYNKRLYEYDLELYDKAMEEWSERVKLVDKVKAIYPNPWDLKIAKGVTVDGVKYKPSDFIKPKPTPTTAEYKDYPKMPERPQKFKMTPSGSWNITDRYTYTSAAMTNHEDFTSYYPNMLRMMDAFFNAGLGYDRYGEIFDDKTKYGKLMKDESISKEERDMYSVLREGTKLILNSASGAGDTGFESNVRMNNKIISMRIIGQLFTWRIGQAQTIEGANIISTNTDGLYSVLEAEMNNIILAREAADIHVDIEPEPLFLISKDSNNRAEIKVKDGQLADVIGASGGTLGCRKGPTPTKSLAHPAIIDWALTEYLTIASIGYKGTSIDNPFVREIGMSILKSARQIFNDDVKTLTMFQNIIASSTGSQRFIFATTDDEPDTAIPLQHYNRCFIFIDKADNTYHLKAASAKAITDAMVKKRNKMNERMQQHDPVASSILIINGVNIQSLPTNKEATVTKITGVEDSWYMHINNNDLYEMEQSEIDEIFNNLDYEKYLTLLRDSFEKNWRNITPEWEIQDALDKAKEKESKAADLFGDNDATDNASAANNTTTKSESDPVLDIPPIPMEDIQMPKMILLNKTLLSESDISNGEHHLCMNGVRAIDVHTVLAKLLQIMTDTNIDE